MPNTTTTEMTAAGRRTFDKMTARHTAFASFAEMEAACATGYAPTLNEWNPDAAILGVTLEGAGHRVFWVQYHQ